MNNNQEQELKESVTFTLELAKALQQNGIPAHRMEETLFNVCDKLNIKGGFFTSPGGLIINIGQDDNQKTHFIKAAYGDLNLEKIDKIDTIYKNVIHKKISAGEGFKELEKINLSPNRYSTLMDILFFGLSTGSAARLFGGGYAEIIVSGIIGLFIGILNELANRFPRIGRTVIVISSLFAMAFSKLAVAFFGNYSIDIATITGLIILIPGFSFTVSITELVNGHPIAGTARFANTIISLLMIGLGIGIGSQIDKLIEIVPATTMLPVIPSWTLWIALTTVPLGFVVLFKAIPKDFIWILLACLCSYFSFKLGSIYLGKYLAVFIASFSLGITSNIFSLIFDRPVSIMLVPGIILLVPGSLGFQSISDLMTNQTLHGIETAFSMTITTIALVSGIVFSNIILSAKKSL